MSILQQAVIKCKRFLEIMVKKTAHGIYRTSLKCSVQPRWTDTRNAAIIETLELTTAPQVLPLLESFNPLLARPLTSGMETRVLTKKTLTGDRRLKGRVFSIAFSPDGKT